MSISNLFSQENYPRFRAYTILVATLIVGGYFVNDQFGLTKSNSRQGTHQIQTSLVWSHSTNKIWENTSVEVEEGDQFKIIVSGSYYDDKIQAFDNDTMSQMLSASGIKKGTTFATEKKLNILPQANYGQLLLQVANKNAKVKVKPKAEDIIRLQNGLNTVKAKSSGIIWLTTNHPSYYPYDVKMIEEYNKTFGDSISPFQENKKPEPYFENNFGYLTVQFILEE